MEESEAPCEQQKHWDDLWRQVTHTFNIEDISYSVDLIKLDHLRKVLPRTPVALLEVGCGSARLACLLAREGFKTTALDISAEALRVAQSNYQLNKVAGRFIRGRAEELPFLDNTFDVVTSTGLLEHYPDPFPIVREMVRVLRPGGIFYSDIVPRKPSLIRLLEGWRRRYQPSPIDQIYEAGCGRRDIEDWLQRAGLARITVFPAGVFPPLLPLVPPRLNSVVAQLVYLTRRFWALFDNTLVAEWLGFYYIALAHKPERL